MYYTLSCDLWSVEKKGDKFMEGFARFIVKFRKWVLAVAIFLLIPSAIGALATKINYDILTYLPPELDSMIGEQYLEHDFNLASTAIVTVENMPTAQLLDLKDRIATVDGVDEAFWVSDIMDVSVPKKVLPKELYDAMFNPEKDATMLLVRFKEPASEERTMAAIRSMKKICGNEAYLGGASVVLTDTKDIVDAEMPTYIIIAVSACLVVLFLGVRSNAMPFIFMMGLAFPILYNFGSNIIFGQISYITEALSTVLQLGVTMDYSIFLLHRYQEEREKRATDEEAMVHAIVNTASSISASSLTTIAGFIALCTMRLTLGKDIGLVMAKGVALGVLCTVTILPAMILCMRKWVYRRHHKLLIKPLKKASYFVTRRYKGVLAGFCGILVIFGLAYPRVQVYYTLADSLPQDMTGIVGIKKMKEDFNMISTYFIVMDAETNDEQIAEMSNRIEGLEGVTSVLSLQKFVGSGIPKDFLPSQLTDTFEQNGKTLVVVNSALKPGTDEINDQIDEMRSIVLDYDSTGVITGEAPMTKDLIEVADIDFKNVSWTSTLLIFAIIALTFKSFSIPILLVMSIEAAIVINMSIPYFTGSILPFIASIVIGTIQLGATVDYAILMTNRFEEEISQGYDRKKAAQISVETCSQSILSSGLSFFAATVGVSFVSKMELLKSICLLIARGALISMAVIIFVLPSLLIIFEPFIRKTTYKWAKPKGANNEVQAA